MNYLAGVNFYDKFRYKIIDERALKERNIAHGAAGESCSVTSSVTIYHIPSRIITRGPLSNGTACINIIDSPGFGDTRGYEYD